MRAMTKVLDRIPPDAMAAYTARQMTSVELAALVGTSAVYLRKIIKRPKQTEFKRPSKKVLYKTLYEERQRFRKSIAHLPVKEIQARAHVSASTAERIKKRYA